MKSRIVSVLLNADTLLQLAVKGRMAFKHVHNLIPGSYEYFTLHNKRDFRKSVKVMAQSTHMTP